MVVNDLPQSPNDSEEFKPWSNNSPIPRFPEWTTTMAVIRDSSPKTEFSVFPPINHENLHLSLHTNQQENQDPFSPPPSLSPSSSSSLASSSFSPSDSDQSDPDSPVAPDSPVKRTGEVGWWVGIGLEMLRSRILGFVSSFGGNGVVWWKASSFASCAGIAAAAVMIWSLYVRARQRRRVEKLMGVVREKDQKINQLLHQIAQLNELLISRHRALASKVSS